VGTHWRVGDKIPDPSTHRARWEIHDIKMGGMGVVYFAYDHQWQQPFAIKTFRNDVFTYNPGTAQRFTQEALSWIKLDSHPNVARAHMVDTVEGQPLLFLELVSGGDLGEWVGMPKLTQDLPQVLRFGIQFCDGMMHAQSRGIAVHRDIKPKNCLVTSDRTLKVSDFGLAKVLDDEGTALRYQGPSAQRWLNGGTQTGRGAGTAAYMAPEQFESAKHVDVRADVYSFGIMLFEMITGRLPFVGNWQELKHLHQQSAPQSLARSDNKATQFQQLNQLVLTCLDKDPIRRLSNFEEVRKALVHIYESWTGKPAPNPVVGEELKSADLSNKGVALSVLGRHKEALDVLNQAIELKSHDGHLWLNKGVVLRLLRRHAEAIESYDRALQLTPADAEIWYNKGNLLFEDLRRFKEALSCYESALDLNPDHVDALYSKGACLGALGRPEEVLPCCDRALSLNPRSAPAWVNKAAALMESKRHGEAVACLARASELPLSDATLGSRLAAISLKLQQYEQAVTVASRALEINPRHAESWFSKGTALAALGRHEEALKCFEEARLLGHSRAEQALFTAQIQLNQKEFRAEWAKTNVGYRATDSASLERRRRNAKEELQKELNDAAGLLEFGQRCLEAERLDEAERAFTRVLQLDSDFGSFARVNALVNELAKQERPFKLSTDSRKAMCLLGFIYERQGKAGLAEDYILDAAYDCEDAAVLTMAGRFYLESFNAEVGTAIAYFIRATSLDAERIDDCDAYIRQFIKNKRAWYPLLSWQVIEKYLEKWESHKKALK
jgi:serine/threonine protein kinase